MRSTALAFKDEDDEVLVSTPDLLEANVATIRRDLDELKTDFRAAVARIDDDIKVAVSELRAEIRFMAAKAEKDLKDFATRVEQQFADLRQDISEIRQDIHGLRGENKSLRERIDRNHDVLTAKIDATNATVGQLDRKVDRIGTRLTVLLWLFGVLGSSAVILVTVGKALKWF